MARTANVFARVEPEIKEQAENVLDQLGIPMSNAVGMFLRQIVLQKGIPFEMKLPRTEPLTYGSLTKEKFDKNAVNYALLEIVAEYKRHGIFKADILKAMFSFNPFFLAKELFRRKKAAKADIEKCMRIAHDMVLKQTA